MCKSIKNKPITKSIISKIKKNCTVKTPLIDDETLVKKIATKEIQSLFNPKKKDLLYFSI